MGRGIRILVVDDQPVVCEGLDALTRGEPDIEVVGHAPTLRAARQQVRNLKPQVVVMEAVLGSTGALALLTALKRTAVVVFSAHRHDSMIRRATRAGVWAYILKSDPTSVLIQAIRRAADGEYTFSPALKDCVSIEPSGMIIHIAATNRAAELTPRQIDVVHGLVHGLTVRQIAAGLSLSDKTVDNHKTKAMAKLGVHNRAELVKLWYDERLWTLSRELPFLRSPAAAR